MSSQKIGSAVDWLHGRIKGDQELNAELFARLRAAQLEQGLRHGPRPVGSFLQPLVMSRSVYEEIGRAAVLLAAAFERIAVRALEDESLLAELALTERETALARVDPAYPPLCVTARLDAYLGEDGFKFLEYNAESPAGLADQMLLEKIFFTLPHMAEFLSLHSHWLPRPHRKLLRSLIETYRLWGGAKERPTIAIVDWKGVETEGEFYVLRDYFESEGYPTLVADPHDLEYHNERLSAGGQEIDILYKRVITHEFLEKFDDSHPLLRAYADRKICLANSFRAKMVHKKAGFAILSDARYEQLFTPEQRAVIRKHIPWTRRVREGRTEFAGVERDMVELLRGERARLVLKPNDDYGGQGVVIGKETEDSEWEEAVARALGQPFVVQELVPARKELMPTFTDRLAWEEMTIDFDPFLFLNEPEGGIVRLSTSSLSNVSSGGGVTALLVLENS